MTADASCVQAAGDGAHVAGCASCRATARVLAAVERATAVGDIDLWPRLAVRLVEHASERVEIRFPRPGWQAAAAAAAIVAAFLVAPEPGRLLAVMIGAL